MRKASQAARILSYLRTGKRIDDDVAREEFDCRRLAARICDIRGHGLKPTMLEDGEEVVTDLVEVGLDGAIVAEYYLTSDKQLSLPL